VPVNTTTDKLYYPIDGAPVSFVAYYPYSSGATSTNKITFDFTSQDTQAKKEAKNFLWGEMDPDPDKTGIALKFSHKFSKIRMTVIKGSGGPSLTDLSVVQLTKMPKTATVYLSKLAQKQTGDITVSNSSSNATTITSYVYGKSETKATVEAIVAPHTGTGNFTSRTFTFAAGDKTFTHKLDPSVTFEAGKVYEYTFTLEVQDIHMPGGGVSNCYMVGAGVTFEIPVSLAYTYENGNPTDVLRIGGEYKGEFTTEVVWSDYSGLIQSHKVGSGTGNATMVEVQIKSGSSSVTGNAVVAIKNSSGVIVWSWHIWVTDYAGNATFPNTNKIGKRFVFMDRHLGATKASTGKGLGTGLFYQWGRKDPFPATGSVTATTIDASTGTLKYAIQHPGEFLIGERSLHYTNSNLTVWGHSTDLLAPKTIYDPCPTGWRVPVNSNDSNDTSPWYGFSSSSWDEGYTFATNAKYPASGFRAGESGEIKLESTAGIPYGGCWSASPRMKSNNDSGHLYFHKDYTSPLEGTGRTAGMPVRCVEEW
jgi:hypothetical protein